jgi:hypothetical protein
VPTDAKMSATQRYFVLTDHTSFVIAHPEVVERAIYDSFKA